jgi:hypothetical protein
MQVVHTGWMQKCPSCAHQAPVRIFKDVTDIRMKERTLTVIVQVFCGYCPALIEQKSSTFKFKS